MHKSKYIAMVAAAAMALTLAGCGSKGGELIEVTPTPMATPTPTVVPVTVTPLPTSTPAPKMIGTKTAQAKFVYLTNSLQSDIRELYLKTSGNAEDEEDWGKNLISVESAVKASEQVQMYYGGESATGTTASTDTSSDTASTDTQSTSSSSSAKYDMKLVTADGSSYVIYSINFGDMEKASLMLDEESDTAYLRYMSISTKKETDTRGNTAESSSDSSDESSSDNGDSSDDSSSSYDDSSYDSSDDSSYDSSYDDSDYDSSYDDSSYDSSDDYDYDDGSYDDSYDDSSDDSYYDDGYYDEGYDTDESSSSDWDY